MKYDNSLNQNDKKIVYKFLKNQQDLKVYLFEMIAYPVLYRPVNPNLPALR